MNGLRSHFLEPAVETTLSISTRAPSPDTCTLRTVVHKPLMSAGL